MTRRTKTVASPLVQNIMLAAEAAGMGREEFIRRTGVTADEVVDPSGRVGRGKYERVLAVLHALPPVPPPDPACIGLGWLEESFPYLVGDWLNAPTLRDALASFLRHRPILGESDWVELRERDGVVQVEYVAEGPQAYAAAQALGNFGILVQVVRAYAADTRFCVELAGSPPPSVEWVEALLRGAATFDQARNLLRFDAPALDARAPHHNPALARILARQLQEALAALDRDASLALTVERALRRALGGGAGGAPPDAGAERMLERVCEDLTTSRWTLRRRLAEEGVTFKALHARVRLQEARRLLEESALSLGEVSDRLGFSSQSSFTRFFRHELGVAPLRYRAEVDGS